MHAHLERPIEPALSANEAARTAQSRWALTSIKERLRIIRKIRALVAENAELLATGAAAVNHRPLAEKLASEVLPLADACRWLEQNAARVLAPRRCGKRGRPFWLQRVAFEVQRQPLGLVLVIGPGNYPLFLPAVQTLHALVAGNAVLLKPAPGTRQIAIVFAQLAYEAGLNPALLTVLPETVAAAYTAISEGVDKVIFTGASENGRDLLATLAKTNTPSIMELSGEDPVLILADADLDLVVRALRFGTRLNDGATCIAPRRLIVMESIADDLLARLSRTGLPPLHLERVCDETAVLDRANAGDYGLGASIFSRDVAKARRLAACIHTGFVLINDLIVPTADPRMPFGGVKASGFGTTRGDEGLLEMTFPHVVAVRRGRMHPHFAEPAPDDAHLFTAYIRAVHGRKRFSALRTLLRALMAKAKSRTPPQ